MFVYQDYLSSVPLGKVPIEVEFLCVHEWKASASGGFYECNINENSRSIEQEFCFLYRFKNFVDFISEMNRYGITLF